MKGLAKHIKTIESTIVKIQELANSLELKIEARDDVFNDRTDKWQESDKGEEYTEKTEELQSEFDALTSFIENIEGEIKDVEEYSE